MYTHMYTCLTWMAPVGRGRKRCVVALTRGRAGAGVRWVRDVGWGCLGGLFWICSTVQKHFRQGRKYKDHWLQHKTAWNRMVCALPQHECSDIDRKAVPRNKKNPKRYMQKRFSEFLETSQVLHHFRTTAPLQPFHTGSRVFLQRQENLSLQKHRGRRRSQNQKWKWSG